MRLSHYPKLTCILFGLLAHEAFSRTISTIPGHNSTLTWPAGGKTFPVPSRDDGMTLTFHDLPPELDEGRGVPSYDIINSANTYIEQLQIKGSNPFRGLNFPIGDEKSGELDCRAFGTVYEVRPVAATSCATSENWHFSIQDTIDVLKGVQDAAKAEEGLEESDVDVKVREEVVARVRILSQFRDGRSSKEECLDYRLNENVEEVVGVATA